MNKPVDPKLLETVAPLDHGQWQARLSLAFAQRSRGVRLVKAEHEGPLYVQKAFYPEGADCAHAYLLHPPGGLVTGDTLNIDITVNEGAHALLTTPGAGRVYKARDDSGVQTQNLHLQVKENAVLEWLPLENILFPSAHARMNTRIDLDEQASLIAWDVTCFGLPANQTPFENGSVQQHMQIWQQDKLHFNESLVMEDEELALLKGNAGLRSLPVHGLMVAGPFETEQTELIEALRTIETGNKEYLAISQVAEFLTVRYLGSCTEKARKLFTQAWEKLRPALIDREAVEPRIWRT